MKCEQIVLAIVCCTLGSNIGGCVGDTDREEDPVEVAEKDESTAQEDAGKHPGLDDGHSETQRLDKSTVGDRAVLHGDFKDSPAEKDSQPTEPGESHTAAKLSIDELVTRGLRVSKFEDKLRLFFSRVEKLSDADLRYVNHFGNVQWISLNDTKISDIGLAHLKGVVTLEKLMLARTSVTDQGLKHLHGLRNLKMVVLYETPGVTDQGVRKLRQMLPQCKVNKVRTPKLN